MSPRTLKRKLHKKAKRIKYRSCPECGDRPCIARSNGLVVSRFCGNCGWRREYKSIYG